MDCSLILTTQAKARINIQMLMVWIFTGIPILLVGQNSSHDQLWPSIKSQLEQGDNEGDFDFIIIEVENYCKQDYECLWSNYHNIMVNIERDFNLLAAIFVAEQLATIARQQGDFAREALAYKDLDRFNAAIGQEELSAKYVDKAIQLYSKLGDQGEVNNLEMWKLETNLKYRPSEEVIPEMNALLDQTIKIGDTEIANYWHIRLIDLTIKSERYDELAYHVNALEQIPISDPIKLEEYTYIQWINSGKAHLARSKNNPDQAIYHYKLALQYFEEEPDHWQAINHLIILTEFEWERGNKEEAKAYLDRAQISGEERQIDDLLSKVYALQAKVAEEEERYDDALAFLKKKLSHEEIFAARSKGFDIRHFYLQKEKDQLAVEKKNKDLELQLKDSQLRYSRSVIAFALFLTTLLAFGFIIQRKRKKALAKQNVLIQEQAEELEKLDQAKSHFFANVSHELRTPLTLMLSPISSLLKEEQLSEKQNHLLKIAKQSGQQLQHLVNEILDLSKLEMGKMTLQETKTDLGVFFRRHLAQFESLADKNAISFSYVIPFGKTMVSLDQVKCRQIINNLLSNAFKFTPPRGKVEVWLRLEHNQLFMEVKDSGPGIHPDDLPQLFDRYFQTTQTDKPATGGTGLGLALCQEYIHLFGGQISIESKLGQGSSFRLNFPLKLIVDSQHATEAANPKETLTPIFLPSQASTAVENDGSKPKILVVEDNLDLQDYLRVILSESFDVALAENGQVALDKLANDPKYQLILSDLMMPVMDGYQLLERLKSGDNTRHLPVVMLTARADISDKLKALRIGVDDYLLKPFEEEELLVRIHNLLQNQANRQQTIEADNQSDINASLISEEDRNWLISFEEYIQQQLANDKLSVLAMADEFAMSESTLLRTLKRLTGLSPKKYLQEVRLNEARTLLENRTYNSIQQVANKVGYTDVKSFSRSFKKRFGKLPSAFLTSPMSSL